MKHEENARRRLEEISGTVMTPEPEEVSSWIEMEGQKSQEGVPENPDCSTDTQIADITVLY